MSFKEFIDGMFADDAEKAKGIMEAFKKELTGNYVPKSRLDDEIDNHKATKTQLTESNDRIKGLEKFEGTNAELQDEVKRLKKEGSDREVEFNNQRAADIKERRVKTDIGSNEKYKPHDIDLVYGMLDMDKVVVGEDDKVSGVNEQLEALFGKSAFLFTEAKPAEPKNKFSLLGGKEPEDAKGGSGKKQSDAANFGASLANAKLAQMGKKVDE